MALDMHRSELYCCACRDYIYDPDFYRCLSVSGASVRVSQHSTPLAQVTGHAVLKHAM